MCNGTMQDVFLFRCSVVRAGVSRHLVPVCSTGFITIVVGVIACALHRCISISFLFSSAFGFDVAVLFPIAGFSATRTVRPLPLTNEIACVLRSH